MYTGVLQTYLLKFKKMFIEKWVNILGGKFPFVIQVPYY